MKPLVYGVFSGMGSWWLLATVTNRQWDGLRKQVSSEPINHGNASKSVPRIILFMFAKTSSVVWLIACQELSESVPWNPSLSNTGGWGCQNGHWSEAIFSWRSGLVFLINNWDPRYGPQGMLLSEALLYFVLFISEISVHIILIPSQGEWMCSDVMHLLRPAESSRTQDKTLPVSSRLHCYLSFHLFCYFFLDTLIIWKWD